MNHYEISQDPIWHKWLDAFVILAMGVAMGIVLSQFVLAQEVTTVTTTEVAKRIESAPKAELKSVEVPVGTKLEEN